MSLPGEVTRQIGSREAVAPRRVRRVGVPARALPRSGSTVGGVLATLSARHPELPCRLHSVVNGRYAPRPATSTRAERNEALGVQGGLTPRAVVVRHRGASRGPVGCPVCRSRRGRVGGEIGVRGVLVRGPQYPCRGPRVRRGRGRAGTAGCAATRLGSTRRRAGASVRADAGEGNGPLGPSRTPLAGGDRHRQEGRISSGPSPSAWRVTALAPRRHGRCVGARPARQPVRQRR